MGRVYGKVKAGAPSEGVCVWRGHWVEPDVVWIHAVVIDIKVSLENR